jgi:ADP-ribosylation factor-binding protein GGA
MEISEKAVNPSNDDLDISSIDGIVNILKAHPDLSFDFTKILIPLLRSSNIRESLLSLEALEEFMDSQLPEFQIEVSKFRFLNELIRKVSKKYEGNQTPKEVKDRILDVLFTWTDKYPDLTKIKDCYEMLKTQGIVHEPIKNVIKSNRRQAEEHKDSTLKLMESEKFKKLLQSKNPMDIQAANLMIQNMVRDNDRRLQLQSRRLIEVKRAHENSILLMEMLDIGGDQDDDTLNTMKEIYNNCEKLKPTIARLAEESQDNEKFLGELFDRSRNPLIHR